jgi:hypothetical protein
MPLTNTVTDVFQTCSSNITQKMAETPAHLKHRWQQNAQAGEGARMTAVLSYGSRL